MKSALLAALLLLSATAAVSAYSINDLKLSRSFDMAVTQRDPMRMPSQTPMVPYKVNVQSAISQLLLGCCLAAASSPCAHGAPLIIELTFAHTTFVSHACLI